MRCFQENVVHNKQPPEDLAFAMARGVSRRGGVVFMCVCVCVCVYCRTNIQLTYNPRHDWMTEWIGPAEECNVIL